MKQKKRQGVEGIGAFLNATKRMLILWDATYCSRLWCVFEMAAFSRTLKNRSVKASPDDIRIFPLVLGPMILVLFLCCVAFWALFTGFESSFGFAACLLYCSAIGGIHFSRGFARDLDTLWNQLSVFSAASANCYCCDVGHVDQASGKSMLCDRLIVNACITDWFDSVENFNSYVREDLRVLFKKQLGVLGIPYAYILLAGVPCLWATLDTAAGRHQNAEIRMRWYDIVLDVLIVWFLLFPFYVAMALVLGKLTRTKRNRVWKEFLVTAGTTLLWLIPTAAMYAIWKALSREMSLSSYGGRLIFFLFCSACAGALYLLQCYRLRVVSADATAGTPPQAC